MIDIKDIVTLDDNNDYIVVSKLNYQEKTFYYLLDIYNDENIKFCYENNREFVEIEDKNLITNLLPLFLQVTQKEIESDQNN